MARSKWSEQKVEKLLEAIWRKDTEVIDEMVATYGKGSLPGVSVGYSYGSGEVKSSPVLAACIGMEDLDLFDHMLELGMVVEDSDGGGSILGNEADALIFDGEEYDDFGKRNPEMVMKLAKSGFDFSSLPTFSSVHLREFLIANWGNIELFEAMEHAGLKYWTLEKCGNPDSCPDEQYIDDDWKYHETIPWEIFLCEQHFESLEHFLSLGYRPARPLRLQVGLGGSDNDASAVKSTSIIDFICEHQLPAFGIIIAKNMDESDVSILRYAIQRGMKLYNPKALFSILDYDLIKLALEMNTCEIKPEYTGPAEDAGREDILDLYRQHGISLDDATANLVDELSRILEGANFRGRWYAEGDEFDEAVKAATNSKELRVVRALRKNATADWKKVTALLARLYCAPFDNDTSGEGSTRAFSLSAMAGDMDWRDIFSRCLDRFEGNLDIKLVVPMVKTIPNLYSNEKGFGVSYWFDPDYDVYKMLSDRGATFLCKVKENYCVWYRDDVENNDDAKPGDAFIWLSPEVSAFLFELNGWDMNDLEVSHSSKSSHRLGYDNLKDFLVGSGNIAAYQWFIENASEVKEFKKPTIKDVVASPLLRPYLEGKKDGSVKSKDNVNFIMKTIESPYRDDALLYIQKAFLDADAIEELKSKLSGVKNAESKAIAVEAISLLESRASAMKPAAKNKLTVSQTVSLVCDALDEGDQTKLGKLEPIAEKVPMADCVELLERAAANCDRKAIDKLYDLFAPFEYTSSALLIALFSGNASTAKALVGYGANLDGKLARVDEKRAPAAKRDAREKCYSHGLIGKTYSSGGRVARHLPEALTKYKGALYSRTKTSEPDYLGRTGKLRVNDPSNENAAKTLIAIAGSKGFEKSIAVRLLWNFISFDGRKTTDACFDAENSRRILESGILDKADVARLPWPDAVWSAVDNWNNAEELRLVKDFATKEQFAKCWGPRFARPDSFAEEHKSGLALFADVLTAENCKKQFDVLKALIVNDELEALKKFAAKPGWFTGKDIKKLIDLANDQGNIELTAWLLDLSEKEKAGELPLVASSEPDIPVGGDCMTPETAKKQFGIKEIGTGVVAIESYKGRETNVVVPALIGKCRVSALRDRAFSSLSDSNRSNGKALRAIESIELPEGMTTIGGNAFAGLGSLKRVSIPSSVTYIGGNAFFGCSSLKEIAIDNPEVVIEDEAFAYCFGLSKVVIPKKFKESKKRIFGDDTAADFEWI